MAVYVLYEDQRAKMVDTLSENSKKEYPVSYRVLKATGK
jgi:hypothetical protein